MIVKNAVIVAVNIGMKKTKKGMLNLVKSGERIIQRNQKNTVSATLDRINNENHMSIDNVQILCHSCNTAKGTKPMEEYIDHCKFIANKFAMV